MNGKERNGERWEESDKHKENLIIKLFSNKSLEK